MRPKHNLDILICHGYNHAKGFPSIIMESDGPQTALACNLSYCGLELSSELAYSWYEMFASDVCCSTAMLA